jgi:hypothetical protein
MDLEALLGVSLLEFEVAAPTLAAIERLGLATVRQLLATPAREFMNAAGDYRSVSELRAMLMDAGLETAGTPFGQWVPFEDRSGEEAADPCDADQPVPDATERS